MTESYAGLYYGHHDTTETTFKKALLLYDELHIFDRASFSLKCGIGTIGEDSPFRHRSPEWDLRVVCHTPEPLDVQLREAVDADLHDPNFVHCFICEFFGASDFAWHFLPRDNGWGVRLSREHKGGRPFKNGCELREMMAVIDWTTTEFSLERLESANPQDLVDLATPEGLSLQLNWYACKASYDLNSFLLNCPTTSAVPFTDIEGYHNLLLAKYSRIVNTENNTTHPGAKVSYIAHTILDEFLVKEILEHRTIDDIVMFRGQNQLLLQDFRGYLREIQHRIECDPLTTDFEREVQKLMDVEVFPKAKEYRDNLAESWKKLFGAIAPKTAAGAVYLAAVMSGVPLETLVNVGGAAGLVGFTAADVISFLAQRRVNKRNNGLAYLLRL